MGLLVLSSVDVSRDSVPLSDTSTGELDSDDVLVGRELDDEVGVEIDSSGGSTEVRDERQGGRGDGGRMRAEPSQPLILDLLSSER